MTSHSVRLALCLIHRPHTAAGAGGMDDRTRAGRARGHPSPGVNAGHSGDNPDAGLERLNRLPADASRMSMRSTHSGWAAGS